MTKKNPIDSASLTNYTIIFLCIVIFPSLYFVIFSLTASFFVDSTSLLRSSKLNNFRNNNPNATNMKQFANRLASIASQASQTSTVSSTQQRTNTIPHLLYGTAWKKERTQELVELAVRTGFRGIDTACQPKHYFEPGVGLALQNLYKDNVVSREEIFLQTKFTSLNGQDPNNVPYDPKASLHDQVIQSFNRSCSNLHTDYLDSLILHSPMNTFDSTMEVWRVFEGFVTSGLVRHIGISNIYDLRLFTKIYESAAIKPKFVQNRFYKDSGYDVELRNFCKTHGVIYQSFWTLTANPGIVGSSIVRNIARKYEKTNEQVFFAFVRALGITFLTGTKSEAHMKIDIEAASSFILENSEVEAINQLL